jgi:predicted GNAT superfamily acetyltransferase
MAGGAWELAHDAAASAGVALRPLETLEDADRLMEVMTATWGDPALLAREIVRALQGSGNVPVGAFEGDTLVGYVLGFLGANREGGFQVWSHMLAVLPGRRHGGVGYALKLAQRAQALDIGVRRVRWTFDPLQARNAYFNIAKLGAVADRFHQHHYGDMDDSLNRGERTDRLESRWDLDPGPRLRPPAEPPAGAVVVLGREGLPDLPSPTPVRPPGSGPAVVWVPTDYPAIRERDPALAGAWREASAAAIEACLGTGLVGTAFLRQGAYVFTPEEEP